MSQTGDMRVQLKLVLDARPDAVWAALRSPAVLAEVSHPFFSFEPLSPRGLPKQLDRGAASGAARALFDLIPAGEQLIDIATASAARCASSKTTAARSRARSR